MKGRNREVRDAVILAALSGNDDISSSGFQIENDYLKRESEENRREAGFRVRVELHEFTAIETSIWKANKAMEACYLARWKEDQDSMVAHLEKEYDEDRMHGYVSLKVIKC